MDINTKAVSNSGFSISKTKQIFSKISPLDTKQNHEIYQPS